MLTAIVPPVPPFATAALTFASPDRSDKVWVPLVALDWIVPVNESVFAEVLVISREPFSRMFSSIRSPLLVLVSFNCAFEPPLSKVRVTPPPLFVSV